MCVPVSPRTVTQRPCTVYIIAARGSVPGVSDSGRGRGSELAEACVCLSRLAPLRSVSMPVCIMMVVIEAGGSVPGDCDSGWGSELAEARSGACAEACRPLSHYKFRRYMGHCGRGLGSWRAWQGESSEPAEARSAACVEACMPLLPPHRYAAPMCRLHVPSRSGSLRPGARFLESVAVGEL